MKHKVLYIGNKLSASGRIPTTIDTLGKQFEDFLDVVTVSDKKNKMFRLLDMLFAVFKNRHADYVIIDTYSTSAFYFAWIVAMCCRLLRKKYIPILHGGDLPTRLDNSPKLSKTIFCHAYVNVTPSDYLHHEFEIRGYKRLITIPNNISTKDYRFKKREKFSPKILWVRSFARLYNCEMAVEVLKQLLDKYPEAELCMVGPDKDGSMLSTSNLSKRYGIEDKLKITGQMSKQAWHELSESYDIFISTTNFDNTPVSIIEAMALGLPVVSTNVGGMPYLIKDGTNGYLVNRNDVSSMCYRIMNIIDNPDKSQEICANARKKIEAFDWNIVKEKWRNILK